MDEKKEKTSKKINIKNKKEATKVLTKKSTTPKAKKAPAKKTTTKKVVKKVEPVVAIEEKEKKLTKQTKAKKVETKKIDKTKVTTKTKKEDKKVSKKKKTTKEPEHKLVLPKEWQEISKNVKKEKETTVPKEKFSGRLRSSIFEEVDEKTFLIKKQKEKENIKKTFLIILIVVAIILISIYLLFKYNENLRKQLEIYDVYPIGTKVQLKDESIWYVVDDSMQHEETVKLLKAEVLDVNGDSKISEKDTKKYNTTNESVYDEKNENSAAAYLVGVYKKELEGKVGPIVEISLLTSKEYVKIREKMGFGYEWTEGNWLANSSLGSWWVISSPKSDSVYVVTKTGTYKLSNANATKFVRPTIVIRKASVTKLEEPKSGDSILGAVVGNAIIEEENKK